MNSLADVIRSASPRRAGVCVGRPFVDSPLDHNGARYLRRAGYFLAFLYLLCGAARLARFHIQHNPVPKNRSRIQIFRGDARFPRRRRSGSDCHAADGDPIRNWIVSVLWLALLV